MGRFFITVLLCLVPQFVFAEVSAENVTSAAEKKSFKETLNKERQQIILEKKTENETMPDGFVIFKGLVLCIGLFLIGVAGYQKFYNKTGSAKGGKRCLQILEKMPLSPKTTLLLVECDGEKLLLTLGNERVTFASTQFNNLESQRLLNKEKSESFADIYDEEVSA